MKTIILLSTTLILLASCSKEKLVEKRLLYGNWTYTKAEETKTFSANDSFLDQYDDIEIFINKDETFTWKEDSFVGEGHITLETESEGSSDPCASHDDLVFHFDNGHKEMFHNWSQRKRKNIMKYRSDGENIHFELTKDVVESGRRNPNDPINNGNNGSKGGK